jgi:hypothetical protein
MTLIGILVGLGCLQVSQRNALFLRGYTVGERMSRVHTQEADVSWLNAHVVGLASPAHLSRVAHERQLKLVGWLTLSPTQSFPSTLPPETFQGKARRGSASGARPLTHIAAMSPVQPAADDEVSD